MLSGQGEAGKRGEGGAAGGPGPVVSISFYTATQSKTPFFCITETFTEIKNA